MYTIDMAYCGTGNNKAIKKLLHVAVSEVNDDMRGAAVMGLGFLLLSSPTTALGWSNCSASPTTVVSGTAPLWHTVSPAQESEITKI